MRPVTRLLLWIVAAAFSAWSAIAGLARYASYHNHTFDLAYYTRQAWGLAHDDFWEPMLGSDFLGTHVSVVLWPLGLLGKTFGTVQVLIFAQALAFGVAALPLAQIGARRFGDAGAIVATLAWLGYPNLGHVASYEFHPGAIGVLPLAIALDAIDRRDGLELSLACVALLCCRADFALLVLLLGLPAIFLAPTLRRGGIFCTAIAVGYLVVQATVFSAHWPQHGSLEAHFGAWGGSPFGIVQALFSEPARVLAHFAAPERLGYLPAVLLPLALMPLFAPRWLLFALPFFAVNLISTFPTTTQLYSHYLTLAVPTLVAAALDGVHHLAKRWPKARPATLGLAAIAAATIMANVQSGGMPWSHDYVRSDFKRDAWSDEAARTVAAIDPKASVQAPDALLPHLAERQLIFRGPPPNRNADFVVLDVRHRVRFAHQETLLRTTEEPTVRNWLARDDYGLVNAEPSLLTLERGRDPRGGLASRYFPRRGDAQFAVGLTHCMAVVGAWLAPDGLELELYTRPPCANDLALRIGADPTPARVDLLFDGLLSPSHLLDEYVLSFHPLDAREREAIEKHGLYIGAVRSSGAPPEPSDPVSAPIPLVR